MTGPAYGEGKPWNCPECGRKDNTGNYCGGCAHPAPWLETEAPSSMTSATSAPSVSSTPKPLSTPRMNLISTSEVSMELLETKTDYRGQINLQVRWSGGKEPYELSCYHYFNDEYNAGVEKCFEKIIDYGGNNVKKEGSHTTTTTHGARIIRLMPGQHYWLVLKDSSGHEVWKEYECPIGNSSDVTIKYTSASFAQFQIPWEKLPGDGYGYSPDKITVKSLNSLKAASVDQLERENRNTKYAKLHYGIIAKIDISGNSGDDYIARYAIILPNGDEYSNVSPIKATGNTLTIQERELFHRLLFTYNEIPTGHYTIIVEVNGRVLNKELILE